MSGYKTLHLDTAPFVANSISLAISGFDLDLPEIIRLIVLLATPIEDANSFWLVFVISSQFLSVMLPDLEISFTSDMNYHP
jgi:hypothetical protein